MTSELPRNLPTTPRGVVYHVGTFDPADKGSRFQSSYEGSGLSVSEHPEEWIQIAKLGGLPTWKLKRPGAKFLDAHKINENPNQREAIISWGESVGLIRRGRVWQAVYWDDEWEQEIAIACASRDEALEEADGCQESIREIDALNPTDRLKELQGSSEQLNGAWDHLLVEASKALGFDGVWWDDDLDPMRLSAPRGVIHEELIGDWECEMIEQPSLDCRTPKTSEVASHSALRSTPNNGLDLG